MIALRPAAVFIFAVCYLGPAFAADTQAMPFVAHEAVYDLTLARSTGNKAPTAAQGRIVYQFSGSACDGYVTNFRQVTELQPAEGDVRVSDQRSTTFEDATARSFRFKINTTIDSAPQDDLEGSATRLADGRIDIALSRPKPGKFEFHPDIVFPTQHLERIIAAAKAGQHTLSIETYDGSDTGAKVEPSFTIIGSEETGPPRDAAAQVSALASIRRWPVSISYFDAAKVDQAPDYRLSFDLYENGVSGTLQLDYGDFVLAGKLAKFEPLSTAPCKK